MATDVPCAAGDQNGSHINLRSSAGVPGTAWIKVTTRIQVVAEFSALGAVRVCNEAIRFCVMSKPTRIVFTVLNVPDRVSFGPRHCVHFRDHVHNASSQAGPVCRLLGDPR